MKHKPLTAKQRKAWKLFKAKMDRAAGSCKRAGTGKKFAKCLRKSLS